MTYPRSLSVQRPSLALLGAEPFRAAKEYAWHKLGKLDQQQSGDGHPVAIRVAMGALCVLTGPTDTLKVGCVPTDAPAGGLAFTDGVRKTGADFKAVFPYLNTPLPGNFNN